MRCECCNKILTPVESTRRFKASETFTDMCDGCLGTILEDNDLETVDGNAEDEELFDEEGNPKDRP